MKMTMLSGILSFGLILGVVNLAQAQNSKTEVATVAGGCFWCIEAAMEKVDGVLTAVSGYTDGKKPNPTYQDVSAGRTGHTEAVEVTYDPTKVTYREILTTFWHNIDPTQKNGQFADKGTQYRTGIYYHNETQKRIAEAYKKELEASGKFKKPIVVEIKAASEFYPAEEYHQDYYKKSPGHYKSYQFFSGRGPYIKRVWGTK